MVEKVDILFMDQWINPNENILRMRLTEVKYAEEFLKYGRVKFNSPESWVDYARKYGDGRGDFYEGTLAFCNMYDISKIKELHNKYNDCTSLSNNYRILKPVIYKDRILYKDERSMRLPCFCLYLLKLDDFPVPTKIGEQELNITIDGSYFKDFVDNQTQEQVESKTEAEQPALIVINDFDTFKSRMIEALISIGLNENDILMSYATYFDFDKYGYSGWYDFQQIYPKELFIKNERFSQQKEGRIIIKTRNEKILQRLDKPIDLGCMEDIALIHKGYYPDGMIIKIKATIFEE